MYKFFAVGLLFCLLSFGLYPFVGSMAASPLPTLSQSAQSASNIPQHRASEGNYPVYRDEELEQRLDDALEVGFYPPNRTLFHQILADVNENTPIDTYVRALSYRAYELILSEQDPDAAFALARQLRQHVEGSGANEARLEALLTEAQLLLFDNQATAALGKVLSVESKIEQVSNPRLTFFANHLIGRILQQNSQYEDALEYFLRSYDVMQAASAELSNRRLIFVNLHIARLQSELRNDDAALATAIETIELAEAQELHARLPDLYLLKGFIEGRDGPNDTALESYHLATQWADRIGDNRVRLLGRNNAGSIYLLLEQYDEARAVLSEGLELAQELGREQDTDIIRFNLAYIDVLEGEYEQGIEQMEAATERYQGYARQAEVADWLEYLAHAYALAGRFDQQAETLLEQRRLRDEIFRSERDRTISALQIRFESQEQSRQIELLRQRSELQAEQLANQELQQQIVKLVVVIVLLGLVILVFAYRAVRRANMKLNEANKALHDQSIRDPLTGLLNRRSLHQSLQEHQRLIGETDAIFLVDIDLFKQINDLEGHAAGDEVLRTIAERLKRVCRDSDLVVRWGGEEFLIVLKHTSTEALSNFANRLLKAIGDQPVSYAKQSVQVTATAGFVTIPLSGTDADFLDWERATQLADLLLYYGKAHGRNQVNGIVAFTPNSANQSAELMFEDVGEAMRLGLVKHVHIAGPEIPTSV